MQCALREDVAVGGVPELVFLIVVIMSVKMIKSEFLPALRAQSTFILLTDDALYEPITNPI